MTKEEAEKILLELANKLIADFEDAIGEKIDPRLRVCMVVYENEKYQPLHILGPKTQDECAFVLGATWAHYHNQNK